MTAVRRWRLASKCLAGAGIASGRAALVTLGVAQPIRLRVASALSSGIFEGAVVALHARDTKLNTNKYSVL